VACVLFVAVVTVQIWVGAYRGERSNYSDEAAHFMNGLLVRDYLTQGLGSNPVRFAEQYYLSYPKIAPGMWPPLFHGVLGLVLLPGWPPDGAALVLLALVSAWAGWRLYRVLELFNRRSVALLFAALFLLTPAIADLASMVMIDIVVAALALEATYWLAVFFATEDWRHAVLFGLFSALCCLTKGNGVALVLLPPLLILFTGRFRLLRRPEIYLSAVIVLILAAPLLLVSYRLDAAIGDFGDVGTAEVIRRTRFYGQFIWQQMGAIPVLLALIGLVAAVRWRSLEERSTGHGRIDDLRAALAPALAALVIAALTFHLLNPHRVIAGRYVALALAPLFGLVPFGVKRLCAAVCPLKWHSEFQGVLFGAIVLNFFVASPAMTTRQPLGWRETAGLLQTRGELAGRRMLVVSDERGEGAFVSEVAVRRPMPPATVIRGSKLLATDDWGGHNFRMHFSTAAALMQELEDLHVDYLIVDSSRESAALRFWPQIRELLETHRDRLEEIRSIVSGRPLAVYRLTHHSPGPAKRLQVPLTYSLHRVLER
jgi:hypothetical protein